MENPKKFIDNVFERMRRPTFPENVNLQDKFDAIVEEVSEATTYEAKMKAASHFYSPEYEDQYMEHCFTEVKDQTNFKSRQRSEQLRTNGNIAYLNGDNQEAGKLYTKSIAYAPLDSSELSLTYANRSAVLRSMGKCRECLVDIERALSHRYSRDKSFKLLLREMQCHRDLKNSEEMTASFEKASNLLQSMSGLTEEERVALKQQLEREKQAPRMEVCMEEVIFPEEIPELSYGASPEVPGASSAVRIEYNEQQGRHLMATRDINIGDVLLIGENLVVTLRDDCKFDHCHKLCHNLLPCPNCVWVMFCSEQCQTEADKKYHSAECAALSRMRHIVAKPFYPIIIPDGDIYDRTIRLLAMIGIDNLQPYLKYARINIYQSTTNKAKRTKGFNANGVFDSSNIDAIFNLCTYQQDSESLVSDSIYMLQIARCFGMSMDDPDLFAVMGLCLQLQYTSRLTPTSKSYFISKPVDVAVCFDPLHSLLNHSCFSNSTCVTLGNNCVRVAKWPIAKGSIVTESYVPGIDVTYTKEERQEILKDEYLFDCKCEACKNNLHVVKDLKCISDPADQNIATKLCNYDEKKIVEMSKVAPNFEQFQKERCEFLSKLWEKGEFHDARCGKIQHQLEICNWMQGNRVVK